MSMLLCSCAFAAAMMAQVARSPGVDPALPEDLNGDRVVDQHDRSLFQTLSAGADLRADVNLDGAVNSADEDLIAQAQSCGKQLRFFVPEATGLTSENIAQSRDRVILLYRVEATGTLGYASINLEAKPGVPPAPQELMSLRTGHILSISYRDGVIDSITYGLPGQPAETVNRLSGSDLEALELEGFRARPLPPAGTCAGCVPFRRPTESSIYIYSTWSLQGGCLEDVWACESAAQSVVTSACCFDGNPGTPACPN